MDGSTMAVWAWSIVTGIGLIGTLLLAQISLERVEKEINTETRRRFLNQGKAAVILIFLSFSLNMWLRIWFAYKSIFDLVSIIIVTIWPIIAVIFYKNKAIEISALILAFVYGLVTLYAVVFTSGLFPVK